MGTTLLERELKRGSTEVLILALLDERQRHGYDISRLIEERSGGAITFHTASLYPTLLDTFGVPHARLEGPNDVHLIPEYYRLSRERRGPAAVLVGLETI